MNVIRACHFQAARMEKISSPQDYVSRMFAPSAILNTRVIWTRLARFIREACFQKATIGKAINAVLTTATLVVIHQLKYRRVRKEAAPVTLRSAVATLG